MKKKYQVYQVLYPDNVFHEVDGTRCLKNEFPELHLFIHRDLSCPNTWSVSEAYTGMAIAKFHRTKDEALQYVADLLRKPENYTVCSNVIRRQKEKGILTTIGEEALEE